MALFDADQELVNESASSTFAADIEAVRAGTIFAGPHGQKDYNRWRSTQRSGRKTKDLAQLARDYGGQVIRGEFEFRN